MSGPRHSRWYVAVGLTLVLAASLRGQAPAKPETLAYRRVYVPQESLDAQIRGLLPLRREEFERRLKASGSLSAAHGLAEVRIVSSEFRARHKSGQLVGGTASLEVVNNTVGPGMLPLAPCSVAIESAHWRGDPQQPAVLGVDPDGNLVCLVERSGTLELAWSQRGQSLAGVGTAFDLRFPAAPRCSLEIDVPAGERLLTDAGLIVSRELVAGQADLRRWKIELGGKSQARVTVQRPEPLRANQSLVIARETANYSVLPAAIDLDTTLLLDVLGPPLATLTLDVDPGLDVTAIRLGEQSLEWTKIAGPAIGATGPSQLAVELPALSGLNRPLHITATADWPAGQRWTLPRVRLAEGVLQEGRLSVFAPPWLRLEAQPLANCAQTAMTPAGAGRPLDEFQFQLFSAAGGVEIAAHPRAAQLREQSGTDIRIDATQVSGVLIADLSSLGGERFAVEAVLPRHWLIDAVETQPADMLTDRQTTPRGTNQQAIRLNLARSLNESRPLRLIVRAHFRRPAGQQPLPNDFFRLASFPEAREGRRLVSVRIADSAAELQLTGDERLARLSPTQLTPAESRLFESPPSGLLFAANGGTEGLRAALAPTSPRYRADVFVQAEADQGRLRQSVTIHCQPEVAAVHSLLVRLTPRPAGSVTWQLAGEEFRELSATTVESPASDESLYRLTLARPRTGAFELRGEFSAPLGHGSDVSLVWLPEAGSQTGQVEIYSQGGGLSIDSHDAERLPAPAASDDRFTPLQARFRYDAGRRVHIRLSPTAARQSQPAAWIESLELLSRFSADGLGDHEATLRIVNAGLSELRLQLPAHISNLRPVEGEGGAATTALARNVAGAVVVTLPPGQRNAVLRLRYSSSGSPLGLVPLGSCIAPVPKLDLPILDRRWIVSVAPGLAALTPAQPAALATETRDSTGPQWLAVLRGPNWLACWADHQPPNAETTADTDPTWVGWTTYNLQLPAANEARLTIYRPEAFRVWALCLGLTAATLAVLSRLRAVHLLPMGGMLGALALLFSPPWSWLIGGCALGLIAGGFTALWRWRREIPIVDARLSPGSTVALVTGPAGSACLLALLLTNPSSLHAAPDEPLGAPKHWRVVIPVDADQQPVGDYVYLEPEFYEALHKLTAAGSALPAWLLESARYELPAAPRGGDRPAIDELRVQFDLQTYQPQAAVSLPLRRDQVSLVEGRARLDGQPLTLAWSEEGTSLLLTIDAPGRHRLELVLGAALQPQTDGLVLDVSIPAAARATAVVPASSPAEFPSAVGAEVAAAASAARTIPLGTARRLLVRWPHATQAAGRAVSSEVEQLLWWRIRPGSVVVEGRFLVRPAGGPLRELLLEVDPRLRLVAGSGGSAVSRVAPVEGAPRLFRVELAEPTTSEIKLKLTWLWPDAGGAGTLALPVIAAQAERQGRSWIAASVEPRWSAETPSEPAAGAPTAADFIAAWNEAAAAPPALIRAAPAAARPLTLLVVPRAAEQRAVQAIDWSLSATAAAAHATLDLTDVPPSQWTQRLTLPAQLRVQSVLVQQNGRSTAVRWTQQADGPLAIGWLEPPTAEQQWIITAELPVARQRPRLPMPVLRLAAATLTQTRMRIFRQDDVQITLQDAAGWKRQDDPLGGHFAAGLGRLVAVLQHGAANAPAQVRVNRAANEPQVSGTIYLRVQEDDGDWRAEALLDLTVAGGVLDQVRLSLPAEWSGPLEIEPAVEQQFLETPGESRRQLLIRPQQAATGRLQLTIRGPLASGIGGIQAPDVSLVGSSPAAESQVQRLILLDTRSGPERIDWELTGLVSVAADQATVPPAWTAAGGDLLRATAPRFSATARIRQATAAAPRVALADVVARVASGRAVLNTTFTIHPHGANETTFTLPPDSRLVQAQLDGALVQAVPVGMRTFKVAAPTNKLPYRLTLISAAALPENAVGGRLKLVAPQLVGLSPQQTAWSIDAGGALALTVAGQPVAAAKPADVAQLRLQTAAHGLELIAAAQATDIPTSVLAESFLAGWRTYQSALSAASGANDAQRRAEEQKAERARQRLLAAGVLDVDDLPIADVAPATTAAPACFVAAGHAAEIILARPRPAATGWTTAHLAALLAAASLALLVWLQWSRAGEWLAEHGHLLLAAAGLAWWLLMPCGLVGWLLVLAALWLALRWPWPRGAFDQGSTIRRFA